MPRGYKRTVPLYIECKRPGCGRLREVRCPAHQARGGYCSQRCNALVNQNIRKAGLKGVWGSAHQRKRRVLARIDGLTPLEAFKLGYRSGLRSKSYQIRRRYVLTKRPRP